MARARSAESCFVDTWGWLVLANDRHPDFRAVSGLRTATRAWITTDYVLDETMTRLFAVAPFAKARQFCGAIFEAARLGFVEIERVNEERFVAAQATIS